MNNVMIGMVLTPTIDDEFTSQENWSIIQTALLNKVNNHILNHESDDSEYKKRGIPVYKLYISEINQTVLYIINGPNYN